MLFKIEKNLNYDVLRIIFKYLNGTDLSNASQVCKYDYINHL